MADGYEPRPSNLYVENIAQSTFTWSEINKRFDREYYMPTGYSLVGAVVYSTNGAALMNIYYNETSHTLSVLGYIPKTDTPIESNYQFECNLLFISN